MGHFLSHTVTTWASKPHLKAEIADPLWVLFGIQTYVQDGQVLRDEGRCSTGWLRLTRLRICI